MKKIIVTIVSTIVLLSVLTVLTGYTKEIEPRPDKPKITEQEQKYIQLVIEKQYNSLMEQTKDKSNQIQKDYNNIAVTLIDFEYVQKLDAENNQFYVNSLKSKYADVITSIDKLKYIPKQIKDQIQEVKYIAQDKNNYYTKVLNEKEQEKRRVEVSKEADNRTLNPLPVTLGMTKEEVLTNGWGRPIEINRTQSTTGTSEQWVYSGFKYLYFEDGILTTIQD
jgi:hypothetical protein